jgi:hypothetical protein
MPLSVLTSEASLVFSFLFVLRVLNPASSPAVSVHTIHTAFTSSHMCRLCSCGAQYIGAPIIVFSRKAENWGSRGYFWRVLNPCQLTFRFRAEIWTWIYRIWSRCAAHLITTSDRIIQWEYRRLRYRQTGEARHSDGSIWLTCYSEAELRKLQQNDVHTVT